jgi:hypothetical protein
MTEKRIGKIRKITCGHGGYQDAMIGFTIDLGSDKDSWGVGDFRGMWAMERSERCKWTEADRLKQLGETMMWISDLLAKANKTHMDQLKGVPVEVTFNDNTLESWRILTEAI